MNRDEKQLFVDELQSKLSNAAAFYLTDFTGMNVKQITEFAREFDNKPAVKLGVVERREVQPEQVKQLAELPSKEVLLAQLAGGLQAPMARLAGGMQNLVAGLARAVDALRQQREGAGS